MHFALDGQCGEHLADRAVGADGEQAPARPLDAVSDGIVAVGEAGIDEAGAGPFGALGQTGNIAQALVQTAGEIVAEVDAIVQRVAPEVGDDAAAVGDADDEGAGAQGVGFAQRLVGQAEVGVAVGQVQLAGAPVGAPVGNAGGGFGGELIGGVAQEEQVFLSKGLHGGIR